jgi:hypothetical protein
MRTLSADGYNSIREVAIESDLVSHTREHVHHALP